MSVTKGPFRFLGIYLFISLYLNWFWALWFESNDKTSGFVPNVLSQVIVDTSLGFQFKMYKQRLQQGHTTIQNVQYQSCIKWNAATLSQRRDSELWRNHSLQTSFNFAGCQLIYRKYTVNMKQHQYETISKLS